MKNKVSVVLPCLNEEKTISYCIKKAFIGIENSHLQGEVIVADNGSTDNSIIEAENAGAKVVHVSEKGYGSALRGGIEKAENNFIIMGDSDSTYNFEHIDRFVRKLEEGSELVVEIGLKVVLKKMRCPFKQICWKSRFKLYSKKII